MTRLCEPCQSFVDNVSEVYGKGGYAEFDGSRIVRIKPVEGSTKTFDVTKVLPNTVIVPTSGEPQVLPGGQTSIRVVLRRSSRGWSVTHFGIL